MPAHHQMHSAACMCLSCSKIMIRVLLYPLLEALCITENIRIYHRKTSKILKLKIMFMLSIMVRL